MALVVTYDGRRGLLGYLLPYLATLSIRLYTDPLHPRPDTSAAAYHEPTFPGYAPLPLPTWSAVYLSAQRDARTDADRVTWTVEAPGGGDTVYGYYVTDGHGYALWAERDPRGGQALHDPGTIYSVVPSLAIGRLCTDPPGAWVGGLALGGAWDTYP